MPDTSSQKKSKAALFARNPLYRELIKLRRRLRGKTLHWSLYLFCSCLVLGGLLQLHNYLYCHLYAVSFDGTEIGLARDPGEVEQLLEELTCRCGTFYGMEIYPAQEITLNREYRPDEREDIQALRETMMQRLTFLTDAVMVTVDGSPVAPVSTMNGVERVAEELCSAFVCEDEGVEMLDVHLLEEIAGEECTVPPEQVYSPERIASVLTEQDPDPGLLLASREIIASRYGRSVLGRGSGSSVPEVHVQSVEKITVEERIPCDTAYISSDRMYLGESRVVSEGVDGLREATYRITRENGVETARETLSSKVITEPEARVVERGTLRKFAWPVAGGGRISQRFHAGHRAIDIAAPLNTSILAAESGVVVVNGWGSSQGNYIVINHGAYYTLYLHNNANLVSVGQRVSRGQTIARLGSTGHSTGPHLHFEIRRSIGSSWSGWYIHPAIDPLQFF